MQHCYFDSACVYMEEVENATCMAKTLCGSNKLVGVVYLIQIGALMILLVFSQNKRLAEMLRGILPMWDGAQTTNSDAGDHAVS